MTLQQKNLNEIFLMFVENKGGRENGLAQEYETNAFGDASLKNH